MEKDSLLQPQKQFKKKPKTIKNKKKIQKIEKGGMPC